MLGFNAKVNIFAYVVFFSQPKYMLGFNVKVNIFAYVSLANRSLVGHIFEDDESHLFCDYWKRTPVSWVSTKRMNNHNFFVLIEIGNPYVGYPTSHFKCWET